MTNVEAGFLAKLIYTGNKQAFVTEQIKPKLFTGTYRNVFEFIQRHLAKHGEIPSMAVVRRYFPSVTFPAKDELKRAKLSWWAEELRRKTAHNKLADAMELVYEKLENQDPLEARKILEKSLREIASVTSKTKDLDITDASSVLKEEYERVERTGGMVGIPTLLPSLDNCLGGFDAEQLITIIARTNQGKSWLLVLLLYNMWQQGFTVALGTREMSAKAIATRFMSIFTGISHERIRKGKLSPSEKEKYFKALKQLKKRKNKFIIFYIEGGVSYLSAKVEEYKPDVLGIDGLYLMEDDLGSDSDWGKVTNISRGVKALAQRCQIPIVGTSQANRTTSRKTGPEVDNISYSDSLGQDSDIVLGLNQTDEMRNDKEIELRVLKARDSGKTRIMLTWNFEHMKFEEIYCETEETVKAQPKKAKQEKKQYGKMPPALKNKQRRALCGSYA